ncbi:thioredoxin-like domain-containing protein [Hypoxylon rubiginosum]|uniref:Thioredoxin-like domain-containing protein n=1 Tax=Hypoxylon rubiginosum TaxID=110542 RepID=A0ACB9Z9G7_9PEZI|nr:thioredoxin-like domain-containing protein [Hypoxylon rubiginosum]
MLRVAATVLAFHTLLTIAKAWKHVSESEFQSTLNEGDGTIVVAYINVRDNKSEHLETEWSLATPEAHIPFVSVDCEANPAICASHGVGSTSTVKLYKQGEAISTYNGPRRASAILSWASRVQRPAVSEVGPTELDDFRKADETVFLAYLDADDETSKAAFADVAGRYCEEFSFGMTTDADVLAAEGVTAPIVKCYKPLDGDTHEFTNPTDTGALEKFVKEASRPVIGELLPHNHQRFLDRGWSMVYVFAATEAERSEIRKELNKVARNQYESLTMVTVDPLEFPLLLAKLGLDPAVLPAGAVHQLSKDRIYPYPKGRGWTSSELQSWGLDVWQGRIKPWTPPGVTTTYDDLGGRIKATQRVSIRNNIPEVKIRVGGRDEL